MVKITQVPVETEERKTPIDVLSMDVLPLPTRGPGLTPMLTTSGDMQIPLPGGGIISVDVENTAHIHDPDSAPMLDFDSIKTGSLHASQVLKVGDTATDGWRVEMSGVDGTYPIRYWDGTTTKFSLDKNGNVVISGSLIAGEIHIPDEDTTANSFHVATNANTWWGCTATSWAGGHDAATAYVLSTGEARFKKVTLDTDVIISGIQPGTEIAIQGWTSTLIFSSDGYRKVDWSAASDEVIRLLDGTEYTIAIGTTGIMTDWTFIYLDPATSITELQISTTYTDAVGAGKILVAIANLNSDATSEAIYQVFGGMGGNKILVDSISANSASVNEFISNSAQIASAMIGDAHIDGKLTVGVTDADVTADSSQAVAWLIDAGALATEDDLDGVPDGSSYAKVLNTDITAGHILLSACTGNLDNVSDGSSYGKVAITDITSGHIVLSTCSGDLDDVSDGSSYGKIAVTDITSGHITLVGNTASININSSTFGQDGIQLQYNSGNPRAYIGNGSTSYFNFDGTKITWKATNSELDSSGNIVCTGGRIGNWYLASTTIKSASSGNTYIELDQSVPHIKMQGSTAGDVIQMAVVSGAPLLESYKAGTRRMRLDEESLKFYNSAGVLRSTLTGGTTGSGTTGLVGTNNLYIPTSINSAKLVIGDSTTTNASIYIWSSKVRIDTSLSVEFITPVILSSRSSDPASPVAGMIWFNTNTNKFRGYDGSNAKDIAWA